MEGWSYTAGVRGAEVTVYERGGPGGVLYWRVHDPTMGQRGAYRKKSLGKRLVMVGEPWAVERAHRLSEELAQGILAYERGAVTVGELLDIYEREVVDLCADLGRQKEDRRRIKMWKRILGDRLPTRIDVIWEAFKRDRASGRLDPQGRTIEVVEERRPVKPRTVQAECLFLSMAFNWATHYRAHEAAPFLLQENPIRRGLKMPRIDKHAQTRPHVTRERHRALRAVSDSVNMEIRWDGRRRRVRSYLSEVLDILEYHPRRIRSVRNLTRCDLILRPVRIDPDDPLNNDYGDIAYRPELDKLRRGAVLPMTATVRAAVERQLARFPDLDPEAPLFPGPTDPADPVAYHLLLDWYRKAEVLAGLTRVPGGGFHAHRRGWQTAGKHLPLGDRMDIAGWEDERTARLYERPDERTKRRIIYRLEEERQ